MYKGNLLDRVRCWCEHLFCTWEYALWHNWHQSEKLYFEPSQIATVTNCDTIVAICDLSQFVTKALTWHIDSNNTENVLWVLGREPMFTFDMNMKSFIFADYGVFSLVHLFLCISLVKPIIDAQRKPSWEGSMLMWTSFLNLGVYLLAQSTSIWKYVFWTVANCDSHKLRQFNNPCCRILWFVAFCDHGRDGTKWVQ